jgi:hypothetical protein
VLFDEYALTGVGVGELIDIYVYQDADGNPNTGAEPVGSIKNAAIQAADGLTFSSYTLDQPLRLAGPVGDVLIAVVNRTAGINNGGYPATQDATVSYGRSWIGLYAAGSPADPPILPADTNWGLIDVFGAPGNWTIRGYGEKCSTDEIGWLTVSPAAGTTAPGANSAIQLGVDTTGLDYGDHTAILCFDSNAINIEDAFLRVPITVTVVPTYGVQVSPDAALSGRPGATVTYTVQITNTGDVTDTFDIAASGYTWTTNVSAAAVTLAANATTTVTVAVQLPSEWVFGSDSALITVTSQGETAVNAQTTLTSSLIPYEIFLPVIMK